VLSLISAIPLTAIPSINFEDENSKSTAKIMHLENLYVYGNYYIETEVMYSSVNYTGCMYEILTVVGKLFLNL